MKAYFISVMVACTVALAVTALVFSESVLEYSAPASSLSEKDFVRYNSLDQFIEYKELVSAKNKNLDLYKDLSDDQWKEKWERYRSGKIAGSKHSGIGGIYSSLISFVIFAFLFIFNFFLYRKFNESDSA